MACFARHRIFYRRFCGNACVDVNERIVGNHALVHAVESQTLSVGTPECAFIYSEFIAVYALSVNNLPASVGCKLSGFAFAVGNKQVVILYKSNSF